MSIAFRVAMASVAVAAVAIAIVGVGVWLVGGDTFAALMATHGEETDEAHAMFDESVTRVLVVAVAVAVGVALVLAAILGTRLGTPLRNANRAAARIAQGDYAARLPREGSAELASLARSFNEMAAALEAHERSQRQFIANAAHELRTPLTNLQGYLEALRDGVIPPERQIFDSLSEEVDRLVRLSDSLDALAKGSATPMSTQLREVDVDAAIRTAVELSRPAAQAKQIELAVQEGFARARANPDTLAQILANLLRNAIDYTPAGGRVTVRCEVEADDIVVSVLNTGDGIPQEDLPHVFERFYRVEKSRDRRRGGAGIGLAIVRELVHASARRVIGCTTRRGRFCWRAPLRICRRQPGLPVATTRAPVDLMWPSLRLRRSPAISGWIRL
jgi:signal transduction histidine kinase